MPRRPKHRIEARKVFVPARTVPVAHTATARSETAGQNEHGHPAIALTATARSDSGTEAGISDRT